MVWSGCCSDSAAPVIHQRPLQFKQSMIENEFDFVLIALASFQILVDLSETALYHHLFYR